MALGSDKLTDPCYGNYSYLSCTGVRTAVRDAPAIYAVVPNAQHAQEMATRRPRNRSPHVAKKEIRNSFLF